MLKIDISKKSELYHHIKNSLLVVLGTVILAFGTGVFIIPFDLVVGGVSSIGILLEKLIPIELLTADVYITIVTWLFFALGFLILGKGFAVKTLISTVVYPIALSAVLRFLGPNAFGGFFDLGGSEYSEIAILLAALFGGVSVGAGCAITFLGGGSTGGVDVISLTVAKYTRIKSSHMFFIVDATLVMLGVFIIGDFVLTLLGILSAFVSALVIDKIFLGESRAFTAHIVSDKYEEINRAIIEDIDRTTTVISARGGYSGKEKQVLMVSFTMRQYADLISAVTKIDKNAFITVHRAHEINGEGWTFGEKQK